tara:strand:+ start:1586 stop:3274 length:1689 start_codon:yes stop_codon:yes gene_type:complete
MANWKKVIVSGSNAELNQVTASFFSGDGSALTNVPAGSINIESFTDGTGITVETTDKLILSDAGAEKFIEVSQLPFTTANVSTNLSKTVTTSNVTINSSDGDNIAIGAASTSAAGVLTKAKFDEIVANTAKSTNVSTNLSTAVTANKVTIKSSDGTAADVTSATSEAAGIMTAGTFDIVEANKAKNTNVTTNLSITGTTGARTIVSSDGTNAIIPIATTAVAGVMSKAIFDEHTANNAKATDVNHNVTTNLSITGTTAARTIVSSDGTNAVIPLATTSVSGLLSPGLFDEIDANTAKTSDINHNVTTNLSATVATDKITIVSSDGTDAAMTSATSEAAGIMTSALFDALKLNTAKETNVSTNLSITGTTGARTIVSSDGTNAIIPIATTAVAGVMSKAIFDEHTANNAKVTNTDVNVSLANLKTKLAGGFAGNAVTIGDSGDVVTIGNKLVVTGDLTVSGTTTTVDTANLNVTDQFINLNDGGEAADGGIVIEGAGASFGWDNSAGRWAFDLSGATEDQASIASDAFAVSVHTGDVGAQNDGYKKDGNMYIDKVEDIWIYTE